MCLSVCQWPFFLPIRINLDQSQYGIRTFRGVIGGVWGEGGRSGGVIGGESGHAGGSSEVNVDTQGGSSEMKVDNQGGHLR